MLLGFTDGGGQLFRIIRPQGMVAGLLTGNRCISCESFNNDVHVRYRTDEHAFPSYFLRFVNSAGILVDNTGMGHVILHERVCLVAWLGVVY